jgi:UDPglucose 6-dehydrogenase
VQTALEAANCDVLLVLTEWPEFRSIPPQQYAALVRRKVVIDGRNVLDADRVVCSGLTYRGVGRPAASSPSPFLLASAL